MRLIFFKCIAKPAPNCKKISGAESVLYGVNWSAPFYTIIRGAGKTKAKDESAKFPKINLLSKQKKH